MHVLNAERSRRQLQGGVSAAYLVFEWGFVGVDCVRGASLFMFAAGRERSRAFAGARCAVPLCLQADRMGCVWCRCAVGICGRRCAVEIGDDSVSWGVCGGVVGSLQTSRHVMSGHITSSHIT